MSMYDCSICAMWCDTDDGEGEWDVPRINSGKKVTYICGACCEKYVTEDGDYDPNLPKDRYYRDLGDAMAAKAEDAA